MRVLHIGKYYPPHMGGMETHLQHLVSGLQSCVSVKAIVANDYLRTDRIWIDGVEITRVSTFGEFASSSLTWGLSREIEKSDADIVHLHAPNPLAMSAFLRSGHRGKLIITHHADISGRRLLKSMIWPIWRKCMERASAIIVTSNSFAKSSAELGPYREKCRVIPLAVDFNLLNGVPEQDIEEIRSRFPGRIVLFVGRLVPYKGVQYLIEAMKGVDATLLIIGEGPEDRRLKAFVERQNQRVHFLGRVPSLGAYYRAADLFVLPSCEPKEAFGLVQLEAMHCGLPVINTSLATAVPEVSIHGQTGLTVPPGDAAELRRAISAILGDRDLWTKLSCGARKRAAQFTVQAMTDEVLKAYRDVQNGFK
jgi:glycosyltransferase involved in cell wall biosynthesis